MKVARLYDYLDVRIEEEQVPRPGPGEALVRTRACGICSGDVVPWYIRKKAPLVFGHEPVGEIVEVGPGVTHVAPGTRVFVHHHAPCLACRACRRGEFVQCPTWRATKIVPGGMAEYFLVPEINLAGDTLVLPDTVSDEDGALVEPTACVVKSLTRAGQVADASILIIGLGVMGQLHVVLARHLGAGQILAADLVATRCAHARGLGADVVIDASAGDLAAQVAEITSGDGAEVVIVGPATIDALEIGLRCVARGGTVVQFMGTPPEERLQLSPHDLYFREVRLVPSYSCGPMETRAALRYVADGIVAARHVVTHRFPLAAARDAYRVAAQDKAALKTLVTFGETGPSHPLA
ncbi:MAG TPA: alcohol dehydrogenase catalytic domain-containing protein [Candidatus Margulisiibacteriota bacterium]|nr:alcohol dehydrogenase catalytic domain-containing protein [Candidatus Margulisiibacteriota bacterium]